MGSGKYLKRAIEKHGLEAFEKQILHVFDTEDDMNAKEAELVTKEYCLREDTYNLCPGGKGGWGYVNSNSSIENAKLGAMASNGLSSKRKAASNRMRALHDAGKAHTGGTKGTKLSQKTKDKIGLSSAKKQSGSKNSQFGSFWINNGSIAKKCKGEIPVGWVKGRKL